MHNVKLNSLAHGKMLLLYNSFRHAADSGILLERYEATIS